MKSTALLLFIVLAATQIRAEDYWLSGLTNGAVAPWDRARSSSRAGKGSMSWNVFKHTVWFGDIGLDFDQLTQPQRAAFQKILTELDVEKPSNVEGKKRAYVGEVLCPSQKWEHHLMEIIPATLLWTVTTNVENHSMMTIGNCGIECHDCDTTTLSSNLVAHIDWKGKPFETVLESKVFFVTNRNYRLEKQPDRKVYE